MHDPIFDPPRGLSDPEHAAHAWRRFRRIMAWMALASVLSVAAALWWLRSAYGPMPLSMILATIAGVGLSVLLGTALMGLVFMSSGTGHDEDVDRFNERISNQGLSDD